LEIERGYYPSLVDMKNGNGGGGFDFIPNSCKLGGQSTALTMLLTGPNMGGKVK
jgi:DNA mismatch repair ATPase MutS